MPQITFKEGVICFQRTIPAVQRWLVLVCRAMVLPGCMAVWSFISSTQAPLRLVLILRPCNGLILLVFLYGPANRTGSSRLLPARLLGVLSTVRGCLLAGCPQSSRKASKDSVAASIQTAELSPHARFTLARSRIWVSLRIIFSPHWRARSTSTRREMRSENRL